MIVSPCISICKTDPKTVYCYGCCRSNDEKKSGNLTKHPMCGKKISLKFKRD